MALIACVDLDPFLTGLVQRVRPDDVVVEVSRADLTSRPRRRYAAVVMPATAEAHAALEHARLAHRTVLVVEDGGGWASANHPGPAIRRPVDATELRLALGRVMAGRRSLLADRDVEARAATPSSTDGLFALARVATAAAASALAVADPTMDVPVWVIVGLVTWTILRVWARDNRPALVATDLAACATALVASGAIGSPFLLFAAVVAAEVGYAFPMAVAGMIVGLATVVGLVPILALLGEGSTTTVDVIGWGALLPLSAIIGLLAHRVQATSRHGSIELLTEMHTTLDRLVKQAQGVAGTLEVNSVVEQVLTSARRDLGARAGLLLIGDGDVHAVAGAFGLVGEIPSRVLLPGGSRRRAGLPDVVLDLLPDGDLLHTRLRAMGIDRGALVLVVPEGEGTREANATLDRLAVEAAIALDNARMFEEVRELTVDDERRRLARDLHDGVIQSLVHVRFELDLVRRMVPEAHAKDIERLREVTGRAVDEVRATVNDLRSVRLSAGLDAALVSVAREYERPGLRVVVDAQPAPSLTPEAELQLLRIAQEALSNAVHHGKAAVVYVRVWEDRGHAHLQVLDDGIGVGHDQSEAGRGVGLRAMQERADLLGGALSLSPGPDGGTCVQVDVPVGRLTP